MGLYDALNPERALLWLPFKTNYDGYINTSNLLVGDLADPNSWQVGNNCILTRQAGVYLGQDALRVTYNGTTNPWAIQPICTLGKSYAISVWARGNGIGARPAIYHDGGIQVAGTTSTDWQLLTLKFVATSTTVRLWEVTSSGYAEFANPTVYEYGRITQNFGQAIGAISNVKLGDGLTANTIPTQLSKRGFSFNGTTNYIDTGLVNPCVATSPFTISCLIQIPRTGLAPGCICSTTNSSTYEGFEIQHGPTNYIAFIFNNPTASQRLVHFCRYKSSTGLPAGKLLHYCATYNGSGNVSGVTQYLNGYAMTPYSTVNTLAGASTSSPQTLKIMRAIGPLAAYMKSELMNFAIYPSELSAEQVKELERRMRQYARIS